MNDDFNLIWNMLSESFDTTVLREKQLLKQMIAGGQCQYFLEKDASQKIDGALLWCDLKDFIFLEYLVVTPEMRGRGIGQKILSNFLNEKNRTVILEVEIPRSKNDRKRIEFYKKLNFHLNEYPYTVPPFHVGDAPLDLMIMSFPKALSEKTFHTTRDVIFESLYRPFML